MSDGGKGSSPRPYSISQDQFANNWDAIFGKKKNIDTKIDTVYNNAEQQNQLTPTQERSSNEGTVD